MRHSDVRAHGLQALDVLIDGARADGATTRQRHTGAAEARQQGAEDQDGRPHGLDQLVRRLGVGHPASVKRDEIRIVLVATGDHAHVGQQLERGGHVLQLRHIGQGHRLGAQQRGAQVGQGGVLGAGDRHFALEATTATDQEFVHETQRARGPTAVRVAPK
jgi:hypothetical protein